MKIVFSIAGTVEFQVQTNPTDLQPIPCQELNSLSRRDDHLGICLIFGPPFLTYWRLHPRLWDSKLLLLLECFCFFGFGNKVIYYWDIDKKTFRRQGISIWVHRYVIHILSNTWFKRKQMVWNCFFLSWIGQYVKFFFCLYYFFYHGQLFW